jgi:hypothetical protein
MNAKRLISGGMTLVLALDVNDENRAADARALEEA